MHPMRALLKGSIKMEYSLKRSDSMKDAIRLLNETGKKICFVLSETELLEGVVTDSEIRRAFIDDKPTSTRVHAIMNTNPICRSPNDDPQQIKKEVDLLGIHAIPIVDQNKKILDIIYGSFVEQAAVNNTTVFILAGGFGKRLGDLTKSTPKPMLKVDGMPMLERIIRQFHQQGFTHFIISTYYMAEIIVDYFGSGSALGVDISYTKETTPLGTAGSLSLLHDNDTVKDNLIIINGDVLTNVDFRDLANTHETSNTAATICVKEYNINVPYGVCEIENGYLHQIKEKPDYEFLVNTGIYALKTTALDALTVNEIIDMPDFIMRIKSQGSEVGVYPVFEYWLDVGHPKDFKKAQSDVRAITEK